MSSPHALSSDDVLAASAKFLFGDSKTIFVSFCAGENAGFPAKKSCDRETVDTRKSEVNDQRIDGKKLIFMLTPAIDPSLKQNQNRIVSSTYYSTPIRANFK